MGPSVSDLVVVGTGPLALRCAATLSAAEHAVRVLGLPDGFLGGLHREQLDYGRFSGVRDHCVGPSMERCEAAVSWLGGGELHGPLSRRISVARGLVGCLQRLAEHSEGAERWCQRQFTRPHRAVELLSGCWGEEVCVRSASDAAHLLAADRRWFAGDAEQWRLQAIGAQGGEVVDDVDVLALEIRSSRVVALETDFGREWLETVLFFDVPIHRLLAWLPRRLGAVLRRPASRVQSVHCAQALVPVDACHLPERVLVGDNQGVWQVRPLRNAESGSTHVLVDLRLSGAADVRQESAAVLEQFLMTYPRQLAPYGEPRWRIWEEDCFDENGRQLLARLNGLGLYHVSQAELWLRSGSEIALSLS
jgi:hypothetical protein